jgi:hypothetical protein
MSETLDRRERLRLAAVATLRAPAPGPALPHHSPTKTDVLWTCLCHPLALAVLEHRASGGWWAVDPFARADDTRISVVPWHQGTACVNGLAMPRAGCDQAPQHGHGVDSGDADMAAYWVDTVHDMPTIVEVPAVFPDTLQMVGLPLHRVVELPPMRDDLLDACLALSISAVHPDRTTTSLHLEPAPWVAAAPTPAWAAAVPGLDPRFLSITVSP